MVGCDSGFMNDVLVVGCASGFMNIVLMVGCDGWFMDDGLVAMHAGVLVSLRCIGLYSCN